MTTLNVGDTFQSFTECEIALKRYGEENFTVFVKTSSSRLTDHPDSTRLVYNFVKFECKQGSRRKSKSQGTRPNQRTVKQNCDAYIRIVKKKDGERSVLKVKSLNLTHKNHPVDKKTVSVYPENRKANVTETVRALAAAKVPNKELRKYIADSQGVVMLPMDVYNMTRRLAVRDSTDSEGVEHMLKLIRDGGWYTKFGDSRFLKARQIARDDRPNVAHATDIVCNRRVTNTQEGRFRVMSAVTSRLNAVFQVMGEERFGHRMEQLEHFLQLVTADKDFSIVDMTVTASRTGLSPDNSDNDITETATPLDNDITETAPPLDNDITETAPALDNDRTETAPSSSSTVTDNDSFSLVRLLKVKTHERPRNVQAFTRWNKRRRIDLTADILLDRQPTNDTTVSLTTQDVPPSVDITDGLTDCETAAASDNLLCLM